MIHIDGSFIREWHQKYEEKDEGDYKEVCELVARDLSKNDLTISVDTFRRIWRWKGAMRVIRHLRLDVYEDVYAPAVKRAYLTSPEKKILELISPESKLPGVGAPTASTVLHFMHPNVMPIIDVRAVGTLFRAGLLTSNGRELRNYEPYRQAIETLRRRCPGWSIRHIDMALFAYHKLVIKKKSCAAGAH